MSDNRGPKAKRKSGDGLAQTKLKQVKPAGVEGTEYE